MNVDLLKTDLETAFHLPGTLVTIEDARYAVERTFTGEYCLWLLLEGRRLRLLASAPVVRNGIGGPSLANIADVAQKFSQEIAS